MTTTLLSAKQQQQRTFSGIVRRWTQTVLRFGVCLFVYHILNEAVE
jgi:hypothetical protein